MTGLWMMLTWLTTWVVITSDDSMVSDEDEVMVSDEDSSTDSEDSSITSSTSSVQVSSKVPHSVFHFPSQVSLLHS